MENKPMKNLYTLLLLLIATLIIAQPQNTHLKDYIPNNPTAAAFDKNEEIPVNTFNGQASVGVKIGVIAYGPLKQKVSLGYNGSGIRVEETATSVGLGWQLSACDMITRDILGQPDELFGTGFIDVMTDPSTYVGSPSCGAVGLVFSRDYESDMYTWSAGGYGGKFTLGVDYSTLTIKILQTPKTDARIERIGARWRITTPDGTVHYFGTFDSNATANGQSFPYRFDKSMWYVDSVVSHDNLYRIKYEYEAEYYAYKSSAGYSKLEGSGIIPQVGYSSNFALNVGGNDYYYTATAVNGHRIKRIYTPLEEILFVYNTNRQDLEPFSSQFAKQLNEIQYITGSYCTKHVLSYSYFQDPNTATGIYPESKRLKLLSVQELSCNGSESKPPYAFVYNSLQLPWRLSKARDHWGYFNGEHGNDGLYANIPAGTLTTVVPNQTYGYGGVRAPDPTKTQACMLINMTDPIGGRTFYTYENHTFTSACTPLPLTANIEENVEHNMAAERYDSTSQLYTTDKIQIKGGAETLKNMQLSIGYTHKPKKEGDIDVQNIALMVELYDEKGILSKQEYTNEGKKDMTLDLIREVSSQIKANRTFYIKLNCKVEGAMLKLKIVKGGNRMMDNTAGGLRIKQVRYAESSSNPDRIEEYSYSGGHLYYSPSYAVASANFSIYYVSTHNNPFAIAGGYIGYGSVDIRKTNVNNINEGHTTHTFFNNCSSNTWAYAFPVTYPDFDETKGMLNSSISYNANGTIIHKNENSYSTHPTSQTQCINRVAIATNGSNGLPIYYPREYTNKEAAAVTQVSITVLDGVSKVQSFTYGANHLNHTGSSVTNSDGRIHTTTKKYTRDEPATGVIGTMQARNILAMTEEIMLTNGTAINGTRLGYKLYGTHPYLEYTDRYEAPDVNGTNTWTTGTWQRQTTVNAIDATVGVPMQLTVAGWAPINMTWSSHGLLESRTFINHTQSYTYIPGTKLMQSTTQLDGTSASYTYDALMRLHVETDVDRAVTKEHLYHHSLYFGDENYTKDITKYPPVAGSGLDSIVNIMYKDYFGREDLTIRKYAAPITKNDIIYKTEYDGLGRPAKQYDPISLANNHGAYYDGFIPPLHVQTTYEDNPLNRAATITPQAWVPTQMQYGHNTSAINHPDGTTYPIASLYKHTTIDPDNKTTIVYTDKLDRKIAEEKSKVGGSESAITYFTYDDRGRLLTSYPSGSSNSTPELLHRYRYDTDDLLTYRKTDKPYQDYVQNSRHLTAGVRDANLTAQSKWMVTQYDAYGRPSKRGFQNGSSVDNAENPTIHVLIEEYFYDGYNGSTTNSAPIYKGKLKRSRIKKLDNIAANNTWETTDYDYDMYGRASTITIINTLGTTETNTLGYDFGDNVISLVQTGTYSGTAVSRNYTFIYDDQGRLIEDKLSINGQAYKTLATYDYDIKGQLIQKNIGKFAESGIHQYLQSIDYTYTPQGWLQQINTPNTIAYSTASPCTTGVPTPTTNLSAGGETDSYDAFYLKLDYGFNQAGLPPHFNGNINTMHWRVGQGNDQLYSYDYDYQDRVTNATHGEKNSAGTYLPTDAYSSKYGYDVRGNIITATNKGMVSQAEVNPYCRQPQIIDSLQYMYAPNTNTLLQVIDKTPCEPIYVLPKKIDLDQTYAANKILSINTTVDCNINIKLMVSTEFKITDSFMLPKLCGIPALVTVKQSPCPDDKYTEGFNQQSATGQYLYDANGNMTYDPNKNLTISYNHLNLPYKVEGTHNNAIHFEYTAVGTLLQKKFIKNNVITKKIDYLRGVEIRNDTLESIAHKNGRLLFDINGTLSIEYTLRDHLGNSRLTFIDKNGNGLIEKSNNSATNEWISENHYYVFGMEMNGAWKDAVAPTIDQRALYNGKEISKELEWNAYAYGFRNYLPDIGRFMQQDPLTDIQPESSPYHYANNSPVMYIDLFGLFGVHSGNTGVDRSDQIGGTDYCPTCPDDAEHSKYRESKDDYFYDDETGMVFGSPGVTVKAKKTLNQTASEIMSEISRSTPKISKMDNIGDRVDPFVGTSAINISKSLNNSLEYHSFEKGEGFKNSVKRVTPVKTMFGTMKASTALKAANVLGKVGIGLNVISAANYISDISNGQKAKGYTGLAILAVTTGASFICPPCALTAVIVSSTYSLYLEDKIFKEVKP
jgi:RHS repeat-associated protein